MHWVAWKAMTKCKEMGGLGFKELRAFNDALLTKQLWMVVTKPNLLMSKVMKEKYFHKEGLLQAKPKQQSSWIWKSWMSAKYLMEKGLRYQVGDGQSINM